MQDLPFVSIVMPVRNEADFIEKSLSAIFAQSYPHELLEIIVADGISTDGTLSKIENLKTLSAIPVRIIENPKKIAPSGLNLAIAEAAGDVVIRVDGHCEVAPDYVEKCVAHLMADEAECVGGAIETIGESLTARAVSIAMSSKFGVGGSAFRCSISGEKYVDTAAFPAYRREILNKTGAFNEELVRNQDDEYSYRLRKSGGRILLAPDVKSRYYSRSNLKSLWRQYFQYGYWKIRVLQLHPKQMSLRQFVPFVFVSALVVLSVCAVFSSAARVLLLGLIGSYLAANFAATLYSGRRAGIPAMPLVSLSYAILHFSYGLGFIAGLFVFRHKWSEKQGVSALNSRAGI